MVIEPWWSLKHDGNWNMMVIETWWSLKHDDHETWWSWNMMVIETWWSWNMMVMKHDDHETWWSWNMMVMKHDGHEAWWSWNMMMVMKHDGHETWWWSWNMMVMKHDGHETWWWSWNMMVIKHDVMKHVMRHFSWWFYFQVTTCFRFMSTSMSHHDVACCFTRCALRRVPVSKTTWCRLLRHASACQLHHTSFARNDLVQKLLSKTTWCRLLYNRPQCWHNMCIHYIEYLSMISVGWWCFWKIQDVVNLPLNLPGFHWKMIDITQTSVFLWDSENKFTTKIEFQL